MIGIVQVGSQAMADRYTYVPAIGIFVIFVWGANELIAAMAYPKSRNRNRLPCCYWRFWLQRPGFKQPIGKTVLHSFRHAIDVTTDNYLAHSNLAGTYAQNRQFDKAIGHYTEALRAKPDDAMAHNNLGLALAHKGRYADAVQHYSEALRLNPRLCLKPTIILASLWQNRAAGMRP